MQPRAASARAVWTAMGIVYIVWGSTYLAIALTVRSAPPLLSLGARFLVAAGVLAVVLRLRRGPGVLRVTRSELAGAALIGVMLLGVGVGIVAYAERYVATGVVALLVAVNPLWTVLIRSATGDRPHWRTLAGVAIGILGLAILIRPQSDAKPEPLWWSLAVMAGALSWSAGSFLQPRIATPPDVLVLATYEMLFGGLAMLAVGVLVRERFDLAKIEVVSIAGWLYLVFIGSLVAYVAYVWLLEHASPSLISTYAYVNPVVAVLLGVLLLGEPLTSALVLGGGVIVLAVLLVVAGERASAPGVAPLPDQAT